MKLFGCNSIGSQPKTFSVEAGTMRFKIHSFASYEQKRGVCFETGTIEAHGYSWKLWIYPRGTFNSPTDTEYVSCFLYYTGECQNYPVDARGAFRTKSATITLLRCTYDEHSYSCGEHDFAKRDDILRDDCDENGALTIDVDIEIATDNTPVWYPKKFIPSDLLTQLYCSTNTTGDVLFIVGSTAKEFKAHRCVLALRAKTLYELILVESDSNNEGGNYANDSSTVLLLSDVDEFTFEAMLEFVYTGKNPTVMIMGEDNDDNDDDELLSRFKSILLVADRFGCSDLKLYAESVLIERSLDPSNAAALLLFADSHSCALLKEASMDAYATNPNAFMNSSKDDWTKLKESNKLLIELLVYTNTGRVKEEEGVNNDDDNDGVDCLDVTSLRKRLEEINQDVDGSREMLVERWKEHVCDIAATATTTAASTTSRTAEAVA